MCVGVSVGLYVGNLQVLRGTLYVDNLRVLWGVLGPVLGCILATYKSYGVCWSKFRAVCWQPTCLVGCVGATLGLYVGVGASLVLYAGNLKVS